MKAPGFLVLCSVCATPASAATLTTCFTPGEDCTALIAHEIAGARHELLVQAYEFTSAPIARAIIDAQQRGVTVRAIFDKSDLTARGSRMAELARAGIEVRIDTVPGIAHNKVMVIDAAEVITGSFNFTASAQSRNAENVLVVRDAEVAAAYRANWMRREAVAR